MKIIINLFTVNYNQIIVTVQTSVLKKPASAIDFKKMGGYP